MSDNMNRLWHKLTGISLLIFLILGCNLSVPFDRPTPLPAATSTRPSLPPLLKTISPTVTSTPPPAPTHTQVAPSLTPLPAFGWTLSSPEEQGMDSGTFAAMLQNIQEEERNIHSILVARHGVLVLDAYFYPFRQDALHNLHSVTKSVTSAAVGIAIQDGLFSGVDTPVYTLFPALTLDDERKRAITIRHLLRMSSGLEWIEPIRSGLSDLWAIVEADSPSQYLFDRPLVAEPGTVFNYNTGGSHLLSVMIQDATGETTAEYADQRLFAPLGITSYQWDHDVNGYSTGGLGLMLRSLDMLRFGQLFLQNGAWEGQQLLPAAWVSDSTHSTLEAQEGAKYGYQWWLSPDDGFYLAFGWGGQQIIVIPQQELVVVVTAGIRDMHWNMYKDLLDDYILPAVKSDDPLPPNPQTTVKLHAQLDAIANPPRQPTAPLPTLAYEINDKTYVTLNGMHGWSTFTFHFDEEDEATLDLSLDRETLLLRVGLDGVYRVTESAEYGPIAMKGYWQDDDTFVLTQQFLKDAERITIEMTFSGNNVDQVSRWTVEDYQEESQAQLMQR